MGFSIHISNLLTFDRSRLTTLALLEGNDIFVVNLVLSSKVQICTVHLALTGQILQKRMQVLNDFVCKLFKKKQYYYLLSKSHKK